MTAYNFDAATTKAYQLGQAADPDAHHLDAPPEDLTVAEWREIGIALGEGTYNPDLDDMDPFAIGMFLRSWYEGLIAELKY